MRPASSRDSQSPGVSRKMARSPRLAHKAPVMQALKPCLYEYLGGGGIESVHTNGVSVLSGLNLEKM